MKNNQKKEQKKINTIFFYFAIIIVQNDLTCAKKRYIICKNSIYQELLRRE